MWLNRYIMLFIVCVLFVSTNGCLNSATRDRAMAIWRSESSTPQEKANAVNTLIYRGATREKAEASLGRPGLWTHIHGQSHYAYTESGKIVSGQGPSIGYWTLDYPISTGSVSLLFKQPATNIHGEFRFIRADWRWRIEGKRP